MVLNERGFPGGPVVKNVPANAGDKRDACSIPGSSRKKQWQPTPVFLPGKFQGQRSLEGCSPWGRTESDNAEHAGMERETERSGLKAETDRE